MKPPLKLNAIDQEHLQELYDSLGIRGMSCHTLPSSMSWCRAFRTARLRTPITSRSSPRC